MLACDDIMFQWSSAPWQGLSLHQGPACMLYTKAGKAQRQAANQAQVAHWPDSTTVRLHDQHSALLPATLRTVLCCNQAWQLRPPFLHLVF